MTVAIFYAQYVLPSSPDGITIQLKQTRYKKFGRPAGTSRPGLVALLRFSLSSEHAS